MTKFTIKNLRNDIAKINGWLEAAGCRERLIEQGRNGYQAVDEYSVNDDGSRKGTWVNCNIGCGTSRECSRAAYAHCADLLHRHARQSAQPV